MEILKDIYKAIEQFPNDADLGKFVRSNPGNSIIRNEVIKRLHNDMELGKEIRKIYVR